VNIDNETSRGYYGWRVLAAAVFGLAFSPGPLTLGSIGLVAPSLTQELGWKLGEIMLSLTVLNVASMLAAPFTGRLADRLGARSVLLASQALVIVGLISIAFGARSLLHFYVAVFFFGLLTVGAQSLTYIKLLTGWFVDRRGLAVGIASSGLGIGYIIIPLIVAAVLESAGWRPVFFALAGCVAIGPLVLALAFARPRPSVPLLDRGDTERAALAAEIGYTAREAMRTRDFWAMTMGIFLFSIVATGVVPHLGGLARDTGLTGSQGAQVAAVFGASTFVGRVLVGYLLDRFFAPVIATIFFGCGVVGFLFAALGVAQVEPWPIVAAAILLGLGFGAESDLIGFLIARYFGRKAFGELYGIVLCAFITGVAIGPAAIGFLRDHLGGYGVVTLGCGVIAGLAAICMSLLGRYPDLRQKSSSPDGLHAQLATPVRTGSAI
jgi:MFS family permease